MEIIRKGELFNNLLKSSIGFVPTMGALHEGHASLIKRAREENDHVVVSIFVNPMQFNNPNDLSHYPRTFNEDQELCEKLGVDYIYYPDVSDIYPNGYRTKVIPGSMSEEKVLCDKFRPGHFDGVLTVVNILFNIVRPSKAYFGLKDAQQCALITQMVDDLRMSLEIVPCETIRDQKDGLALSSRNKRLTEQERNIASMIPETLFNISSGRLKLEEAWKKLEANQFKMDYLEIRTFPDLKISNSIHDSRVFFAGTLGQVRLIDNMKMGLSDVTWG